MTKSDDSSLFDINDPNTVSKSLLEKTLLIIEKKDFQLAELMRAAAIPHRFDDTVLNALQTNSPQKVETSKVLEHIERLSFVYKDNRGEYFFHESIRGSLLEYWQSSLQMEKYVGYSVNLKSYYEEKNNMTEALYHWFVVDHDEAFNEFRKRISSPIKNFDLVDAEILIRLAREQRWNLSLNQQAWVNFYNATLKRLLSEWKEAMDEYGFILSHSQDLPPELKATTLQGLGSCLTYIGRWLDAKKVLEESVVLSEEIGNSRILDNALLSLGWCNFRLRDFSNAILAYQKVLKASKESGDLNKQGWTLSDMGRAYREMKKWKEAIDCYKEALAIRRQIKNNDILVGASLTHLAMTYLKKGEWQLGLPYIEESLSILSIQNDKYRFAAAIGSYGLYHQEAKQFEKSIDYYEKALEIFAELDAKKEMLEIYNSLALVYNALDVKEKEEFYRNEMKRIESEIQHYKGGVNHDN